jgi:D-beta-D-heptose 7-phosphate kinase/D-beta-D-heptose 1-phosphate adenosyltransferase
MASLILRFGVDRLDSYQSCVFTNGCFDILHRGHIELFKFCYKQTIMGQPTVVGVNSDRSIKELKGNNRPIRGEEDRLAVLMAIKWIDYIVVFDTKSVFPVIESLKPKVLVKGGNYSKKACAEKDRIVGEEFVESYGGKVMTAPLIEGVSTTTILERIKNENADSR